MWGLPGLLMLQIHDQRMVADKDIDLAEERGLLPGHPSGSHEG